MDTNKTHQVIKGWSGFVEAAGIENSKISAQDINDNQQLLIKKGDITEDDNGINFSLTPEQLSFLKRRYVTSNNDNEISVETLQVGFPLLRFIEQGKTNYYPLFRYRLSDNLLTGEELNIHIPVKQGIEVDTIEQTFLQLLDTNIQELGSDRHMTSIIAACMEKKEDNFNVLFESFLKWIKGKLKSLTEASKFEKSSGWRKKISLELGFNMLISQESNTDFNINEQLKDYKNLSIENINNFPLLEKYINATSNENPKEAKIMSFPYGAFEEKYPLSHGQMNSLLQVSNNISLIAVQGAPGTGKTTLFKSLIASQIVERALAIIHGKDRNLGILVTSTAIKAVENVIDDLREDPKLKPLNWLFFQSGSKDQVSAEVNRIDRLIDQLNLECYDEGVHKNHANELKQIKSILDKSFDEFCTLQENFQKAFRQLDCDNIPQFIEKCDSIRAIIINKCSSLGMSSQPEHSNLLTLKTLCDETIKKCEENSSHYIRAKEEIFHSYDKLIGPTFSKNEYGEWLGSWISKAIQHHFIKYPQCSLGRFYFRFFSDKYEKAWKQIKSNHPSDVKSYSLSEHSHMKLSELARNRMSFFNKTTANQLLDDFKNYSGEAARQESLLQLKTSIEDLEKKKQLLQEYYDAVSALEKAYPENDWIDVLRKRFISEQRKMFEISIDFLWQELLRQREQVVAVLPLWQSLLIGQTDSGFYKWKEKLNDFYRVLSLAYPVLASPLVSIQKLAGYRDIADFKQVKPHYLSLIDEAGMVSVESMVPILCRSERTILVGDPLQIEPVRTLSSSARERLRLRYFHDDNALYEAVSPALVTAYHRAAGTETGHVSDVGNGILLDEHRRCQPAIAELFMDLAGYKGVSIETTAPKANIQQAFDRMGAFNLMFYGVQGKQGDLPNTNIDEVEAIGSLLDKLSEAGYDITKDVGIITPYSNQRQLLTIHYGARLKNNEALKIGSVHQFQGTGFEVIIYSPVIFRVNDRDFFQNSKPNLINVAVSRAKQQFIVVGNYQRLISAGRYLEKLAKTCANQFLVEMESQSSLYNAATNFKDITYYQDCEHCSGQIPPDTFFREFS
ncbi:AAA domain-containing protein [Hahella sp. NBU794]|uniref:AAA domain-containing protein n=1 Tax=Hahella sp. NBU794 TaxID=3422590 RepID=UPI003D6FED8C